MTPLEIVVRGHARRRYPAERATLRLAAQVDGSDRQHVYDRAVAVHDPLSRELAGLLDAGAVTRWHSDQLRVFSYRPSSEHGLRPLMYRVAVKVEAEFVDFERLSAFLDRWAVVEGIEVGYTNVFWGGRSEIKPSEVSPFAYADWCRSVGLDPESMRD